MALITKLDPKRGMLRVALRFPILFYRVRLGWLFTSHFLMLTHIDRKSGRPRYVVLEVLEHDKATDAYYVAVGWGGKADWFRNVQKTTQVIVYVGFRRFNAIVEEIPKTEAEKRLSNYAVKYPYPFKILTRVMLGKVLEPTREACRLLVKGVQ